MSTNSFQGSQDKVETPLSPVAQQWLKKYVKDIELDSNCKISSALIDDSLEIKIEQLFPSPVVSLAIQSAKNYVKNLQVATSETTPQAEESDFRIIDSKNSRRQTVSILQESLSYASQELFPVCVMLYPILGVKWELVWQMLNCLEQEICLRLEAQHLEMIMPYFRAMYEMFSPAVFEDDEGRISWV